MKILVVGSGGREHAIIATFKRFLPDAELFCANGNGGISVDASCIAISPESIRELAEFAGRERIDLTFVGGEVPLALGIVDEFELRGLRIVGASKAAARLESSKAFAKDFMSRHGVPTADHVTGGSPDEAIQVLRSGRFGAPESPVVIKADGLAAGKGVVVARNRAEAEAAVSDLSSGDLVSAEAAKKIVIEECLHGREVSLLLFTDGKNYVLMPPARDHKRLGENDTGPNTGGMGVIVDRDLLTEEQLSVIVDEIVKPSLAGANADGFPIKGVLFIGLMMTENGAKVLEYNVRFGDPEAEALLVLLETDLSKIATAILEGSLSDLPVVWSNDRSACVILASGGYPAKPVTGEVISGLDSRGDVSVFHAGTKRNEHGQFVTAGGRVLAVTATGKSLSIALEKAYQAVDKISFAGMQYRRDIGR